MSFALAIIIDRMAVTRVVLNTRRYSRPLAFIRGLIPSPKNYVRIWVSLPIIPRLRLGLRLGVPRRFQWSARLASAQDHPAGMEEGSRGLSAAIPPGHGREGRAPRQGCQKSACQRLWHPSGVRGDFHPFTGGIAALNPRLPFGIPPGC